MKRIQIDPLDGLALIGVFLVALGAAFIYLPAAPIVVGLSFLAYSILATRSGGTP